MVVEVDHATATDVVLLLEDEQIAEAPSLGLE